jgi:hypothetical protein
MSATFSQEMNNMEARNEAYGFYQNIAARLGGEAAQTYTWDALLMLTNAVRTVADGFAQDNPRFDRSQFYAASYEASNKSLTFRSDEIGA